MTSIDAVHARQVWDSRGRPTVEVEIRSAGAIGRAIAPAGASTGSGEALDLRDGSAQLSGFGIKTALENIRSEIVPLLLGRDISDQAGIDRALIECDGTRQLSRLGGNAVIATSMAAAHGAAAVANVPLWSHLAATDRPAVIPLPEIQIFGGGAHADRRIDIQDLMVTAPAASSFAQALEWTAEVYLAAGAQLAEAGLRQGVADEGGFWPAFDSNEAALDALTGAIELAGFTPGRDIVISLDIAASEFYHDGQYLLGLERRQLDRDAMTRMLIGWVDQFPIVSIEDPLDEADTQGMIEITAEIGDRVQIIGDDFLVTNAERVLAAVHDEATNAVLIKPNQAGTLTATRAAFEAARANDFGAVVSARSGETEDTTIVDLAVGWGAQQIKVGSITRGERTAKWNHMLRIEERLSGATFAGWLPLPAGAKP